ncbi:DUF2946 family protein [Roseibium litorale]|uniref:Uncharacterized protein n=1 Tax=Roseibium litorale TaxID=2803841 RepID=A0ABR9CP18_9HYPH|nr:DUF2946 family protein [Roseibium litorale]MBD8892404.1 hypothetical protein [Roseibium litorale]
MRRNGIVSALKTELTAAARILLLLPMLLGLLFPHGYMPDVTPDGRITVVLCTSEGLQTVLLNADGTTAGGEHQHPAKDGKSGPHANSGLCAFAAVASLAAIASFGPELSPPREQAVHQPVPVKLALKSGSPGRRGARAPPMVL